MLTKQLAKEAAIIMCNHLQLEVLRVGRWRKDGQLLKRGFTVKNSRGNSIIVEVTFSAEENKVSLKDFFMDIELDDFVPGRGECDDEIETELKDKFDTNPTLNVGLDKPTKEQVKKIGLNKISDIGFRIVDVCKWIGTDEYGCYAVYTNKGWVLIQLNSEGIITIMQNGKVIDFWAPVTFQTTYTTSLLVKAEMFLGEMFDETGYVYCNKTGWTSSKSCMIAYLDIYEGIKKYEGKAILTEDGEINVYAGVKHILSHNCYRGLEI